MTAPSRFTQADITRAMRGARKAGYTRVRVGIDLDGNLVVDASDEPADSTARPASSLDRLLKR